MSENLTLRCRANTKIMFTLGRKQQSRKPLCASCSRLKNKPDILASFASLVQSRSEEEVCKS